MSFKEMIDKYASLRVLQVYTMCGCTTDAKGRGAFDNSAAYAAIFFAWRCGRPDVAKDLANQYNVRPLYTVHS